MAIGGLGWKWQSGLRRVTRRVGGLPPGIMSYTWTWTKPTYPTCLTDQAERKWVTFRASKIASRSAKMGSEYGLIRLNMFFHPYQIMICGIIRYNWYSLICVNPYSINIPVLLCLDMTIQL